MFFNFKIGWIAASILLVVVLFVYKKKNIPRQPFRMDSREEQRMEEEPKVVQEPKKIKSLVPEFRIEKVEKKIEKKVDWNENWENDRK